LRIASLLGLLAVSSPSAAQPSGQAPAPPKDEALDEIARKLYREGHKALEEQRWDQCRASFLAAWKIKQQYQIAGNLAHCEAKLGLHREAGEHLRYFLREAPKDSSPERRNMGEALFEEVRAKVALVTVSANKAGAEILVDGVSMGKTPLPDALVLEPGPHKIEARFAGYPPVEKRVEVTAGSQPEVALEIREPAGESEKAKPVQEKPAVTANPVQPQLPPEQPKLPVRKIVIGTGIGASALLFGIGVGFSVASINKGEDAVARIEALRKGTGPGACYIPGRDVAGCDEVVQLRQSQTTFGNAAIWSFVTGGAIGAGTLVYALVKPKLPARSGLLAVPMAGTTGAGVIVRGWW
jgi:hypothetical protein